MKLDLGSDYGRGIRDRILGDYGRFILESIKTRCSRCWLGEQGRCSNGCPVKMIPGKPVEAARFYLSNPNNEVGVMPFVMMFVVPVYEKETGVKNFRDILLKEYGRLWEKKHGKGSMQTEYR